MNALASYQQRQIAENRKEYGFYYDQLKKPSYYGLLAANDERARLLAEIAGRAGYLNNGTKPFAHGVSPGCRLCGQGQWSCLFVNNRCNCTCFYCPTPQIDTSIPQSQGISFATPEGYIAYLKKFGFTGIGLSGGEPLLTFSTTLDFLSAIKKEFGAAVHVWMYTNGTLFTTERATQLAAAGLDEIRFDLSATQYNTKNLRLALGKIPTVTVEIPAIPDEIHQLKEMVVEIEGLGVNFLNLHQMRLTPHNLKNLIQRNYSFTHGPKITVLESELAALEIIAFVFRQGLGLAVNYCSFHYKNNYQKSSFRKKAAAFHLTGQQEVTQNGFIRTLGVHGLSMPLSSWASQLTLLSPQGVGWQLAPDQKRILLTKSLLLQLPLGEEPLFVHYTAPTIRDTPIGHDKSATLSGSTQNFVPEHDRTPFTRIEPQWRAGFFDLMEGRLADNTMDSEELFSISLKELPATGFAEYF